MIIKIFGQLIDVIGKENLAFDVVEDTNALIKKLQEMYPPLTNLKYAIAINKKIIQNNTALKQDTEIALLPPFSGG
ncbi:MAG: MoaD/ThiS family protein [Parafilimonas sp.]